MINTIKVEAGRIILKDGKALLRIDRQGLSPVEADAMTYYLASKIDWVEFENFVHAYKYNMDDSIINNLSNGKGA